MRTNVWLIFISGGDLQLLDWLFEYVFPTESKFENDAYAERAYSSVIDRSIASGVRDRGPAMQISAYAFAQCRRQRVATMVAYTSVQPKFSPTLSIRKVISSILYMPSVTLKQTHPRPTGIRRRAFSPSPPRHPPSILTLDRNATWTGTVPATTLKKPPKSPSRRPSSSSSISKPCLSHRPTNPSSTPSSPLVSPSPAVTNSSLNSETSPDPCLTSPSKPTSRKTEGKSRMR